MTTTIEKNSQETTASSSTTPGESLELPTKAPFDPRPLYLRKGLAKKNMDALYLLAHHVYEQKKYKEASRFFGLMAFLNHYDKRAWLGAAACYEAMKQYPTAIASYGCAALLDTSDPTPFFRSFNCYFEYNDKKNALIALEAAIETASKNADLYSDLEQQAAKIKEALLK